jgi:hypothetical protein
MAIISDLSARQWKRFKEEKGERESVEGKKERGWDKGEKY